MKHFSVILLCFVFVAFNSCVKTPVKSFKNTKDLSNWMQDLFSKHPNKAISLKEICLPKAHDAGMYELNHCIIANACNVQTQALNMSKMLAVGIRVFDIRPVKKGRNYFTYHKTKCGGIGCNGANLKEILQQTRNFLDKHNELIIFEITHFCKTSAEDTVFLNLLETELGDRIYTESTQHETAFIHRDLKEILNDKNKKGKVVLLMNTLNKDTEKKQKGFFSMSFIPFSGTYANQSDFEKMKVNQLQKFQKFRNKEKLFEISWTLTLSNKLAVKCYQLNKHKISIKSLAELARNHLKQTMKTWQKNRWILKNNIPNIINIDYVDNLVTIECIQLSEFNLEE